MQERELGHNCSLRVCFCMPQETASDTLVRAENSLPYPSWAQFVGAVIVITSVAAVPVVVIVRLIAFPEAREQASQYIHSVIVWGQEKQAFTRRCLHAVRFHSYSRHVDDDDATGSEVPYQAANGAGTSLA